MNGWQENDKEVDFLLYTKSRSLNEYIEKYKPKYAIRISTKEFGYDKQKKIKSIPLYAVFCIEKDLE